MKTLFLLRANIVKEVALNLFALNSQIIYCVSNEKKVNSMQIGLSYSYVIIRLRTMNSELY